MRCEDHAKLGLRKLKLRNEVVMCVLGKLFVFAAHKNWPDG